MAVLSDDLIDKWQGVADFVAQTMDVPVCLIMKTDYPDHSVLIASQTQDHPYYVGQTFNLGPKLYCDRVIRSRNELVVRDARKDPDWHDNDDLEHAMVFYVGLPISWPDGRLFGTICALDRKENETALKNKATLTIFQRLMEHDLELINEAGERIAAENRLLEKLTSLQSSIDALTNADRRKNEFLTMLAHELRNPLAPVRYAAQTLMARNDIDPQTRDMANLIERQVGQMARIVEGLLEVNDIVQENITLRPEQTNLTDIVTLAVESCEDKIKRRSQEFIQDLPDEQVILNVDPARMVQVIGNLLNNASKYTQNGGSIRLTAKMEGPEIIISVSDTGIGLRPDHITYIFDIFKRVDNTPDRSVGGTGLGLTVARKLVELHGGTIQVKSKGLGKGSTFTIRLPQASSMLQKVLEKRRKKPDLSSYKRLLIVDDNIDGADTLAMLMNVYGFETKAVYDGSTALEVAPKFKPDAILLDLGMPDMDGLETCRRMRAKKWSEGVKIIAITGWGTSEYQDQTQKVGFDQHIVKPVSRDDVFQALANAAQKAEEKS